MKLADMVFADDVDTFGFFLLSFFVLVWGEMCVPVSNYFKTHYFVSQLKR